jgi:predicted transposase YbfD/YdcC
LPDELIAIDGKTINGSKYDVEKATHVLNAFATKAGIVLAKRTVDTKTNEIPEIPKLLDDLNIKGGVVSADAMGCQKTIALKIKEKEANYFLALKKNHSGLFGDVEAMFNTIDKKLDFYEEVNKGHGRVKVRRCWILLVPDWLKLNNPGWKSLSSICLIESERHIRGAISIEQRYYNLALSQTQKNILNMRECIG